MYHNLGLRPLRNKDLIAPPGKQPKPTEVLVKEKGALQSVGEKGHNDEHLGTNAAAGRTWPTNLPVTDSFSFSL